MATQTPTLFDDLFSNEEKNEIPPVVSGNKKKKNLTTKETKSSPELFPTEPTLFEETKNDTASESHVTINLSEEVAASMPIEDLCIEPAVEKFTDISEEEKIETEKNEVSSLDKKEEIPDKSAQLADLDKTMRAEIPFFFEAAPKLEISIVAEENVVKEKIEIERIAEIQEEFEQDFTETATETAAASPLDPSHENSLPSWNLENKYYGIGAVAKLFGVNISHIRFWTNEFKLKVRTNKKGDRLYTPELIEKLRWIHHLVKEKGHTIKGAKAQLKVKKEVVSANISLKEQLSQLRDNLLAIREDLNKME